MLRCKFTIYGGHFISLIMNHTWLFASLPVYHLSGPLHFAACREIVLIINSFYSGRL